MMTQQVRKEYNPPMSDRLPSGMKMYAELNLKVCSKCRIGKPLNAFHKDVTNKHGLYTQCIECKKVYAAERNKKYRATHPDMRDRRDYEHKRGLRRNYGITVEQYQAMFEAQQGKCAICGNHQSECKRRLAVDHDHDTGTIRALLCDNCNPGIGYFKHSVERLELAIRYLKKFQN